jgi:hypothetical protein
MRTLAFVAGLAAVAATAEAPAEKRELLARFETVAVYEGTQHVPCRFRTALCPDRCRHAGDVATFRILAHLVYEKPGEYGDPQQDRFLCKLGRVQGDAAESARWDGVIRGLAKGDSVRLDWRHEYVTRDGASFPERPIVRIEKITAEEAAKLAPPPAAPPAEGIPLPLPEVAPMAPPR